MKRTPLLLVAVLALVISACSSDTASPSPTEPEATASPTPEPTEAETASPTDPGSSDVAIPSFDINGDPELAARLPTTVGGAQLQVISFRGDTLVAGGGVDETFQDFLDATGAELDDVSVAFGGTVDGSISVAAFRVLGVSEDQLEQEFLAASQDSGDIEGAERATIGGKDVWTAADATGSTGASVYLYVKDDTVYFMTGTEAQAAEILSALP